MSDYPKPFKPEINVPVWVEVLPHETYGFDPQELQHEAKEIPIGKGKTKKIPASTSWRFNVVDPNGAATSWFINWESIKNAVMEMVQAEAAVAESVNLAVMLYVDDKKHHLCLYTASTEYRVIPNHDVPIRFKEFCGAPVSAAPPAPGKPLEPKPVQPPTGVNGAHKMTWEEAGGEMQKALAVSANAWLSLLQVALEGQEKAKVDGDAALMLTASEYYEIVKQAAAVGISTTAHTLWIDVVSGRRGR